MIETIREQQPSLRSGRPLASRSWEPQPRAVTRESSCRKDTTRLHTGPWSAFFPRRQQSFGGLGRLGWSTALRGWAGAGRAACMPRQRGWAAVNTHPSVSDTSSERDDVSRLRPWGTLDNMSSASPRGHPQQYVCRHLSFGGLGRSIDFCSHGTCLSTMILLGT